MSANPTPSSDLPAVRSLTIKIKAHSHSWLETQPCFLATCHQNKSEPLTEFLKAPLAAQISPSRSVPCIAPPSETHCTDAVPLTQPDGTPCSPHLNLCQSDLFPASQSQLRPHSSERPSTASASILFAQQVPHSLIPVLGREKTGRRSFPRGLSMFDP